MNLVLQVQAKDTGQWFTAANHHWSISKSEELARRECDNEYRRSKYLLNYRIYDIDEKKLVYRPEEILGD